MTATVNLGRILSGFLKFGIKGVFDSSAGAPGVESVSVSDLS